MCQVSLAPDTAGHDPRGGEQQHDTERDYEGHAELGAGPESQQGVDKDGQACAAPGQRRTLRLQTRIRSVQLNSSSDAITAAMSSVVTASPGMAIVLGRAAALRMAISLPFHRW